MSNNIENLRDTIIPKGDQLNADQLLAGPMTITVTGVERGNVEQPLVVHYACEDGKPYKPCKSMRKVLIFAWGENGNDWIGKSMTLYNKPDVKYGGVMVGGIRISHLSDIPADIQVSLTETRGKKTPCLIKRLEIKQKHSEIVCKGCFSLGTACGKCSKCVKINKAINTLEQAAKISFESLRQSWVSLTNDEQEAIGKPFLDDLKQRATQAPEADDYGDL